MATPAARARLALAFGALLVALVNVWIATRLDALLANSELAQVFELDRRVAAFGNRERVRVLALGNSHGLAGVRPAAAEKAWGLAAGEVFNLCLPGLNARATQLMAERYLARFPRATRAVILVDETLVGQAWACERTLRYLSLGKLRHRLAILPWLPSFDRQLGLLVGTWLPLLDQSGDLNGIAQVQPAVFWHGEVPLSGTHLLVRNTPYGGGYPPPWDVPGFFKGSGTPLPFSPARRIERAEHYTRQLARAAAGFADLASCCRWLEERHLRVTLVENPLDAGFRQTLARPEYHEAEQAYRDARARFGYPIVATGTDWPRDCFADDDHLSARGAARLVNELPSGRE